MTRRKIFVLYSLIALACIASLITLLGAATHRQLEYTMSCILSTEAILPALILCGALTVYFVRKARTV